MYSPEEKLCLKWNDFQENVIAAFGDFRKDSEFADVTLACEGGQQVLAHKVILSSASFFFMDILRKNKHPHPLIYMRGIKSEDLVAIIDFLYYGETNVYQENLDSFFAVAEELKLEGLTRNHDVQEKEETPQLQSRKNPSSFTAKEARTKFKESKPSVFTMKTKLEKNMENGVVEVDALQDIFSSKERKQMFMEEGKESYISLQVGEDLEERIESMIEPCEKVEGNRASVNKSCKVCGLKGQKTDIKRHIESHHISGVSHSCNICGSTSRTRDGLRAHKRKHSGAK